MKPEKMDVLLTLLGNIIAGLERDELKKIAYPTQKRFRREMKPGKMDVLLTLLGNIIEGLERDESRKIAYSTHK